MSVGLCICKLIKCVIIIKQLLKSTETVKSDFSLEFGRCLMALKAKDLEAKSNAHVTL